MDHKEMDRLLNKLPSIMEENFPSLTFSAEMRKSVHEQAAEKPPAGYEKKRYQSFLISGAAALVLLCLLGGMAAFYFRGTGQQLAEIPRMTQVESKTIDLDGEGTPEMVNTWEIAGAEREEKLVALIWARDGAGEWRVVSTEPMGGGEFLPLEVFRIEQQIGHVVLISAKRGNDNVLYRVIGFDGQEVTPVLERTLEFATTQEPVIQEVESLLPVIYEK